MSTREANRTSDQFLVGLALYDAACMRVVTQGVSFSERLAYHSLFSSFQRARNQ